MINRIVASILVCFSSALCIAQGVQPPPPQAAPDPPGAPIDGGIFILLVLALIYGMYKAFTLSKKSTTTI